MTEAGGDETEEDAAKDDGQGPAGHLVHGTFADDGGPEEVELLLDGEGPEGAGGGGVEDSCEVCDEESGEQNVSPGVWDEEEKADEAEEIERKDSQGALPVEVTIEGRVGAVFDEERGDEEAGEDEEKIDAVDTVAGEVVEEMDTSTPAGQID